MGVLIYGIDMLCAPETWMEGLCSRTRFHIWSFLQQETSVRPFTRYCCTNCSPHPISDKFIYSLFVLSLCYCCRVLCGEVICPPSISAFPLRCMPCLLLCFCIVPLRAEKRDCTLWIKMHALWGRAHKTKPVREFWLQLPQDFGFTVHTSDVRSGFTVISSVSNHSRQTSSSVFVHNQPGTSWHTWA